MSVDYLTRPLEVFAEMRRVLKPGGLAVMSFSNRCFPTKGEPGWPPFSAPPARTILALCSAPYRALQNGEPGWQAALSPHLLSERTESEHDEFGTRPASHGPARLLVLFAGLG